MGKGLEKRRVARFARLRAPLSRWAGVEGAGRASRGRNPDRGADRNSERRAAARHCRARSAECNRHLSRANSAAKAQSDGSAPQVGSAESPSGRVAKKGCKAGATRATLSARWPHLVVGEPRREAIDVASGAASTDGEEAPPLLIHERVRKIPIDDAALALHAGGKIWTEPPLGPRGVVAVALRARRSRC